MIPSKRFPAENAPLLAAPCAVRSPGFWKRPSCGLPLCRHRPEHTYYGSVNGGTIRAGEKLLASMLGLVFRAGCGGSRKSLDFGAAG